MHKFYLILSIFIFSFLLGITSMIKTKTRIIEKNIYKIDRKISVQNRDLHETQLDFAYLSSPKNLTIKIQSLALIDYSEMDLSRIYLNYEDFISTQKKLTIIKSRDENKKKK